ncbi:hypothetical protein GCM10008910_06360 [Faecalicatena orotica]
MTGILPIAKYYSGSELNMFTEYTMATEEKFSKYFGFTEEETDELYEKYLKGTEKPHLTREGLKSWYDGYYSKTGIRLYNPRSVVTSLKNNNFGNYWTSSGPYDEIYYYIEHNVAEVRDDLALIETFDHLFEDEKNSVSVSSSIGIAIFPDNGETFKNLYSNADRALYQVKKLGKNNYMLYDDISSESGLDNKYFTPRTKIESENNSACLSGDLLGYVFEILYDSEDFDKSVNDVLEIIGKKFDVSRAYIFENSEDNLYTSNTYEWRSEGVTSEIANLQNLSFSEHGNYKDLFKDNTVFYCRDIRTLNPGQAEILAAQGIRSTLQCAIIENKTFTGMIGFDECTGLRLWTQEEISLLIILSRLISLFLQKKKMGQMEDKIAHYQNILAN